MEEPPGQDWELPGLGKRFFDMATPKSELLPVLPMDDVVVLPHMTVTLAVEGDDQKAAIEAARTVGARRCRSESGRRSFRR